MNAKTPTKRRRATKKASRKKATRKSAKASRASKKATPKQSASSSNGSKIEEMQPGWCITEEDGSETLRFGKDRNYTMDLWAFTHLCDTTQAKHPPTADGAPNIDFLLELATVINASRDADDDRDPISSTEVYEAWTMSQQYILSGGCDSPYLVTVGSTDMDLMPVKMLIEQLESEYADEMRRGENTVVFTPNFGKALKKHLEKMVDEELTTMQVYRTWWSSYVKTYELKKTALWSAISPAGTGSTPTS
jgi:hypothetical protein